MQTEKRNYGRKFHDRRRPSENRRKKRRRSEEERDLQLCLNGGDNVCADLTRKKKVSEVSESERERGRDENIWRK
jgi:hypothetical protein